MKVDMRPAYEWTCDACGRDQFVSCLIFDMSKEEELERARQMGLVEEYITKIPEGLRSECVAFPVEVTCQYCNATFATRMPTEMM